MSRQSSSAFPTPTGLQTFSSSAMSSSQSGRKRGAKCGKSVSFSGEVALHEIDHWQQLSEEERTQVWFTRDEFDEIKRDYKEIISKMRNKELLKDTDEYCTRGLECRSKAGARRRRDAQLNALLTVLGEQERQQGEGVNEPDTLAVICRQFTYHSQQAATNMGRRDEQAILEYIMDLPEKYRYRVRIRKPLVQSSPSQPRIASRTIVSPTSRRLKVVIGQSSRRRAAAA